MKDSIVYDFSSDEIEDIKRISGLCEMSNSDLPLTDNCVESNSVSIEVSSNTALQNPDVNGNPVDGGIDRPTVSESVTCNGFKSQLTIFPKSTESNSQNATVSSDHSIYKVMVNDGNPGALKVKHPRNDIVTFQQTNSSVTATLKDPNENLVAPQLSLDSSSVDCGNQSKPEEKEEETALGSVESDVDFDYAISENSALTTIRRDSTKNVVKLESAEEIICSESASSFASASLIPHLQQDSQENLSKSDLSDSRHESSSSNSTTLSTVRHNSSDSIFTANNNDIRPDRINEIPSLKELCLITVLSLPNSLNILENIGLSDLLFENGFNDDDDLEISNEIGNSGGDWCSNPHQQRISSIQLSEATSSSRSESQKLDLEPPPRQTKSQGCNSFVPYRSFSFVQMTSVGTNTDEPNKQDQATDSNSLIEGHSDCEWIGLPTDTHSTILLSPSQYKSYKFPPSPEQNANLLDLHNKFSARRGYHELDWKSAAQKTTVSENSPCSPVSSFRPIEARQVSTESNSSFARRNVNDGNTAATLMVDRNAGGRVNRLSGDARRPSDTSMPTESSSTIHQGALKTFLPRASGLELDLDSRKQTNVFHLDESATSPRSVRQHPGVFRGEEVVEARKSSLEVSSNIEPGYSRLLAIVQENANECHSKSALDSTPGCLVRKGASNSNALPESFRFESCASKSSEVEICETQFSGRAPPVAPSIFEESKRCLVQPENMPEQRFEDTAFDVNHGVNGDIHNTFKPASLNVNKYHEIFKKNDGFFGHFDNSKIVCENVILNYDDNSCTEQIINKEKAALGSPKNGNMIGEVNNLQFFNSNGISPERDDVPGKRTDAVDYSDQIQRSIEESRHFFENLSKIKQRNSWNNFRRSSLPNVNELQNEKPKISKQGDFFEISRSQTIFDSKSNQSSRKNSLEPKSQSGENFRQDMYNEYMLKLAERSERRSNKVIKVSQPQALVSPTSSVENGSNWSESKNDLGSEFIKKVRQRMEKYGLDADESDSKLTDGEATIAATNSQEEENIPSRKGSSNLPKHIQEFLQLSGCQSTVTQHTNFETGVWSPAVTPEAPRKVYENQRLEPKNSEKDEKNGNTEPIPPVWTPKSSGRATPSDQITFKPVKFQSPVPARKASKVNKESGGFQSKLPIPTNGTEKKSEEVVGPSVKERISAFSSVSGKRLEIKNQNNNENSKLRSLDHSVLGQCGLALPKSQNPTITLLQKAREGQLSKGAAYLDDQKMYTKETPEKTKTSEPENNQESKAQSKKVMNTEQKPTEKTKSSNADRISSNNVPGGREENQQKWYKRMYESLHQANLDKSNVTVRYWPNQPVDRASQQIRNGNSGYSSEPEATNHNSDKIAAKYATLDRRRNQSKENDASLSYVPRTKPSNEALKHAVEIYNSQPGRIENYEPGRCSIADKETKEWWDEMMEIFDKQYGETGGHRNQSNPPSQQKKHFMTYTLKDGGYESDSSLVFKRRDENCDMSPTEKKMAYKEIQKGGEVPLHGLRKPAPQRPKEPVLREVPSSPSSSPFYSYEPQPESPAGRYAESAVTLQYRRPVLAEVKEALSEDELARRQAEAMQRLYQEERRRKYLQELHDISSRRHTDHFIPSQKSPIPLNRYDDFFPDESPTISRQRDRTPEPKLVARALYNFVGQSSRELSFRRGDIIFVRRQIDKNWYEGEHNAMIGLFPINYVEIIPYDNIRTIPKKPTEGQARAKFNFIAQSHLELSLVKGELVVLTRRVDSNWFEGRIGNRRGIFPVSYVEVLTEPGERAFSPVRPTTPATPVTHSSLSNGSSQPIQLHSMSDGSSDRLDGKQDMSLVNQTLHIDTQSDPIPYRALYNYRPQNEDELELQEGDTVYVIEKCDDGWYVGSSQRTGAFGTFPGNYVQRVA
ncbi:uncharacterized protein [Bemisia tabaci]|uniref:uncharacterized protein isoform X1 n=1 Tax=Bemisia tabaci TaxID=7038 RepID=UPI003B285A25